jgi:hypothetical protein
MLISEIVPNAGPASSRRPPKSTGYATTGLEKDSKGIKLGVDDIQRFREDREMVLDVDELVSGMGEGQATETVEKEDVIQTNG